VVDIMNNKQHLTTEGLTKIISIRATINKDLSEILSTHFPDINLPVRSLELSKIPDSNWLAGFT